MVDNPIALGMFFAIALMLAMVGLMELGRYLGLKRSKRDEAGARAGLGAIEGSVFALLGLMIAFTFTSAATRFDHRRQLIVQETNAIGTAWLRLDLLQPDARASVRDLFRQYLDQRLDAYQSAGDFARATALLAESQKTQQHIWDAAIAAAKAEANPAITVSLLPALNAMFDIATTRTLAIRMHPPAIIFVSLAACALIAALMAGYGMSGGRREWTHIIVFAALMAGAVYIIIDMEYPRLGMIRVQSFDQALIDLRQGMNERPTN